MSLRLSGTEPRSTEAMVCVAAVVSAHGVQGALKLKSFTELPESCTSYGPLCDESGRELFELRVIGVTAEGLIARASGIEDRDAAAGLRGRRLYVPRSSLPKVEDEEFYHADLIGLRAFDPTGNMIGQVVAVENFGAGDLLEIGREGEVPLLVPFTHAVVPAIDLAAGRLELVVPGEIVAEQAA